MNFSVDKNLTFRHAGGSGNVAAEFSCQIRAEIAHIAADQQHLSLPQG